MIGWANRDKDAHSVSAAENQIIFSAVSRRRALSNRMIHNIRKAQERAAEIKESIKSLNAQYRQLSKKLPASCLGDNRAREILCQEKKMLVDSLNF